MRRCPDCDCAGLPGKKGGTMPGPRDSIERIAALNGERGIRTPGILRYSGFQDRRLKPLGHLSGRRRIVPATAGIITAGRGGQGATPWVVAGTTPAKPDLGTSITKSMIVPDHRRNSGAESLPGLLLPRHAAAFGCFVEFLVEFVRRHWDDHSVDEDDVNDSLLGMVRRSLIDQYVFWVVVG